MGSGGATSLEARGDNQSYWVGRVFGVSAKTRKVTAARNSRSPTSLNDGEYFCMRRDYLHSLYASSIGTGNQKLFIVSKERNHMLGNGGDRALR